MGSQYCQFQSVHHLGVLEEIEAEGPTPVVDDLGGLFEISNKREETFSLRRCWRSRR